MLKGTPGGMMYLPYKTGDEGEMRGRRELTPIESLKAEL